MAIARGARSDFVRVEVYLKIAEKLNPPRDGSL